nr:MAG TPA: hypothetical protein [Caudoviricetes sp.]
MYLLLLMLYCNHFQEYLFYIYVSISFLMS